MTEYVKVRLHTRMLYNGAIHEPGTITTLPKSVVDGLLPHDYTLIEEPKTRKTKSKATEKKAAEEKKE